MAKGTDSITYVYEFEHEDVPECLGHTIEVTRKHVRTAYPRNGNVGNPTEYFRWQWAVDGTLVGTWGEASRAEAYEHARAHLLNIPYVNDDRNKRWRNVRNYRLVADEMKARYVRQYKTDTEVSQ